MKELTKDIITKDNFNTKIYLNSNFLILLIQDSSTN